MRKAKKINIKENIELSEFSHLDDNMTIYRYMDGSYLKKMEKDKKIFLNFLDYYKEGELNDAQRDSEEGKMHQITRIGNYNTNSGNLAFIDIINNSGVSGLRPFTNNTFTNCIFETKYNHNNFYSLCCTYIENDKINFGEGGLVKGKLIIKDIKRFLYFFKKALEKEGIEIYGANKCKYINERKVTYTENDVSYSRYDPAFLKLKIHESQNEFRILCKHKDNRKINKAISVYCPKALEYCEFEYINRNDI